MRKKWKIGLNPLAKTPTWVVSRPVISWSVRYIRVVGTGGVVGSGGIVAGGVVAGGVVGPGGRERVLDMVPNCQMQRCTN